MIPILVQQIEREIGRKAIQWQPFRVRLERAHQQPFDIVAGIKKRILIVQRRQMCAFAKGLNFRQWLGQDVKMLAGIKRHMRARHRCHFARPQPAGDHHLVGLDHVITDLDSRDTPAFLLQAGHAGILENLDPARLGAFRQSQGHVGWIDPTVKRRPDRADHVIHLDQRPQFFGPRRAHHLGLEPEGAAKRDLTFDVGKSIRVSRQCQRSGLGPASGLTCFTFQLAIKVDGIVDQLGQRGRRAQPPDQSRRMPGGAAGQFRALQHDDILAAFAGKVIGDGTADDAAADDNCASVGGKWTHAPITPVSIRSPRTLSKMSTASSIRSGVWVFEVTQEVKDIKSTPRSNKPSRRP